MVTWPLPSVHLAHKSLVCYSYGPINDAQQERKSQNEEIYTCRQSKFSCTLSIHPGVQTADDKWPLQRSVWTNQRRTEKSTRRVRSLLARTKGTTVSISSHYFWPLPPSSPLISLLIFVFCCSNGYHKKSRLVFFAWRMRQLLSSKPKSDISKLGRCIDALQYLQLSEILHLLAKIESVYIQHCKKYSYAFLCKLLQLTVIVTKC